MNRSAQRLVSAGALGVGFRFAIKIAGEHVVCVDFGIEHRQQYEHAAHASMQKHDLAGRNPEPA